MKSFNTPPFDVATVSQYLIPYVRTYQPDHEVAPRIPENVIDLVSPTGVGFQLVRERLDAEAFATPFGKIKALAWCLWLEGRWVGYIGANVKKLSTEGDTLRIFEPIASRRSLHATNTCRSAMVYRCWLTDGKHPEFAPLSPRGNGLMYAAYIQIIKDLSPQGWTLSSSYKSRNPASKAMWERIKSTPEIQVVHSRSQKRDFAFIIP